MSKPCVVLSYILFKFPYMKDWDDDDLRIFDQGIFFQMAETNQVSCCNASSTLPLRC